METKNLTLLAVGDIAVGSPAEPLFALVASTLRSADVVVGQQEGLFTLRGVPTSVPHVPRPHIGCDPKEIGALQDAGFNVMHLASNHTWEMGTPGIEDSIAGLKKYGIAFTGAGMNIDEARRPTIIERKGTRFGFLSYNCVGPSTSWATGDKPGCAYVHILTAYQPNKLDAGSYPVIHTFAEPRSLRAMVDDIQKLRPLCDVLVVHFHKGISFIPVRLAMFEQQVSYAAIDAGADLILGDHAHLLKGIEQYKGKWIFHNLGNFVWFRNRNWNPESQAAFSRLDGGPFFFGPGHTKVPFPDCPEMMMTIIAKCTIENGQISQVGYLPCLSNEERQVEILKHDARGQQVFDYMDNATRGESLNARYEWQGDEVIVTCNN